MLLRLLFLVFLVSLPALAQTNEPRFLLLPLDNRPCNVLFVRQIARIAGAEVLTPPNHTLGSWLNSGQCESFPEWVDSNLRSGDNLIISSDMLCYGGLVASRAAATPETEALARLQVLKRWRERGVHIQVLSTLPRLALRTSDGQAPYEEAIKSWASRAEARPDQLPSNIPAIWVREFLGVRQRNLNVLLHLTELLHEGVIDQLVIGQDDSSAQGLHHLDQERLFAAIERFSLKEKATLLSGADELSMDMLVGRLAAIHQIRPVLEIEYSEVGSERRIPPLESHPLSTMVEDHIHLCGAQRAQAEDVPEVTVFVQVPSDKPFQIPGPEQRPKSSAFVERVREWMRQDHRCAIAGVSLINRMDPYLAEAVMERIPLTQLEGFAAWNTPANAFGTVIAQVVARRIAEQQAPRWVIPRVLESSRSHLSFLLARLIDDYGYQTIVRTQLYPAAKGLSPNPDPLLSPYLKLGREVRSRLLVWARELYTERFEGRPIELPGRRGPARLGPASMEVILPWPRLFEIELRLDIRLLPAEVKTTTPVDKSVETPPAEQKPLPLPGK